MDGEPIIYHGHTLTSRILFLDVVRVSGLDVFVLGIQLLFVLIALLAAWCPNKRPCRMMLEYWRSVAQAIAEYGFKASPYPIILSLEVHCNPTQQDRMAAILRTELGGMLLIPPPPAFRSRVDVRSNDFTLSQHCRF